MLFSPGHATNNQKGLNKITSKTKLDQQADWTISKLYADLIKRRRFSYSANPHDRQALKVGSLGQSAMKTTSLCFAEVPDWPEPERKWIRGDGPVDLAYPVMNAVPCIAPEEMLHVSVSTKEQIMSEKRTSVRASTPQTAQVYAGRTEGGEETNDVILFHSDLGPLVTAEQMNFFNCKYCVLLTPGGCGAVQGCIMQRTMCVAVFRNETHLRVAREYLIKWLMERMKDPNDTRFHVTTDPKPASGPEPGPDNNKRPRGSEPADDLLVSQSPTKILKRDVDQQSTDGGSSNAGSVDQDMGKDDSQW